MNSPRGGVGVTALGDFLYAAGGNNGSSSLGSVERYDPHTDQWTDIHSMNVKRAGVGLAAVEGMKECEVCVGYHIWSFCFSPS